MDFLVFPHLGLGDQIIMSGFIHYLLESQHINSIVIIAYDNYQNKSLNHLYSDCPKVSFLRIEHPNGRFSPYIHNLNGMPFQTPVLLNEKKYYLLNFGVHSQFRSAYVKGYSWADSFYIQGNLDPKFRFSYFKLPSNMINSDKLYERVINKTGPKYILVNDEPKTNRNLHGKFIRRLLEESGNANLPVIYLGLNRYNYPLKDELNNIDVSKELECDSLLDLWKLIQNAVECHLMDSSIACMTDLIKDSNAKLHLHDYATETVDPSHSVFINRPWSIWYKEDLL
jgi:hypothetical protein